MVWEWFLRRLANGQQSPGLWGYLAIRAQNKAVVEQEKARAEAATELIDHLPAGAVYRDGTSDSWREIWIPSTPQQSLFVLPVEHRGSAREPPEPSELASQPPRALGRSEGTRPGAIQAAGLLGEDPPREPRPAHQTSNSRGGRHHPVPRARFGPSTDQTDRFLNTPCRPASPVEVSSRLARLPSLGGAHLSR